MTSHEPYPNGRRRIDRVLEVTTLANKSTAVDCQGGEQEQYDHG